MEKILNIRLFVIAFCCFMSLSAFAQVDEPQPKQDTLYIIEEEITYDTLYLYENQTPSSLLTKEELIEAFQNRGTGQLYYSKGHYYLTGYDEVFKLDNSDLKKLFSPAQYDDYRKSKRNQYLSIPLFAVGSGAAVIAGIGLVQFCANFVQTAKYNEQILNSEDLGLTMWRSAVGGMFIFGGGMLVATGCFAPAAVLTIKSKTHLNRIANDFNTTNTALRLTFVPMPSGAGIILSF